MNNSESSTSGNRVEFCGILASQGWKEGSTSFAGGRHIHLFLTNDILEEAEATFETRAYGPVQ